MLTMMFVPQGGVFVRPPLPLRTAPTLASGVNDVNDIIGLQNNRISSRSPHYH
jgi:hypothetical protein